MNVDLARFKATFFEESTEHLSEIESGLLLLEGSADQAELLNGIFRAAHSIKGASGMFGFDSISTFTHRMESLLDRMRRGEMAVSRKLVDCLLRAADLLGSLIDAVKDGGSEPDTAGITNELDEALRGFGGTADVTPLAASAGTRNARYEIAFDPGSDLLRQGLDPLLLLRDLSEIVSIESVQVDDKSLPDLADLDPETCYLRWTIVGTSDKSRGEIEDVFAFAADSTVAVRELPGRGPSEADATAQRDVAADTGAGRTQTRPREQSTLRVPASKVDKLIDLVGEVVIAQSIVIEAVRDFTWDKLPLLQEAVLEMERNTHELQERVMSVRMVPVGSVFNRFPRLVRDLASTFGKQIALTIEGEEIELDKSVAEGLADPLTHLVRNAVDHGLEAPAARVAAGKPEIGTVRLSAYHRGGSVVIEVSDDGRGLDAARIREKAMARGLIRPDDVLDDARVQSLIFEPGFSTAEVVSDVSGRGVGMDVVRRNVESMNGSIQIQSRPGIGTSFQVRLPLTLAILDGLTVGVGSDTYVIPLAAIVESLRPRREDVRLMQGRGEVVVVRGEPLPLVRLARLFGANAAEREPSAGLAVILDNDGERIALLVDELLGQSQVVIKNLESNYRRVEGIMGATVMGDGRVALIVDVQGLTRLSGRGTAASMSLPGSAGSGAELEEVVHG